VPNRLDNILINKPNTIKNNIKYYYFAKFPLVEIKSKVDIYEDTKKIKEEIPKYFTTIIDSIHEDVFKFFDMNFFIVLGSTCAHMYWLRRCVLFIIFFSK